MILIGQHKITNSTTISHPVHSTEKKALITHQRTPKIGAGEEGCPPRFTSKMIACLSLKNMVSHMSKEF